MEALSVILRFCWRIQWTFCKDFLSDSKKNCSLLKTGYRTEWWCFMQSCFLQYHWRQLREVLPQIFTSAGFQCELLYGYGIHTFLCFCFVHEFKLHLGPFSVHVMFIPGRTCIPVCWEHTLLSQTVHIENIYWLGQCLTGAVVKLLTSHCCDPGTIPGVTCAMAMWSPSLAGGFPPDTWVSPHEDDTNAIIGANEHY